MNLDTKILNKLLANQTQQYIKRIIHHDQVDLSQGCKHSAISESQSVWYTTLKNWRIKTIRSSQQMQKRFSQNSTSTYDFLKTDVEFSRKWGTYLNTIRAIYDHPTDNIMHNSEKLKAFLLRLGIREGCPLLPLLFNIVWKV